MKRLATVGTTKGMNIIRRLKVTVAYVDQSGASLRATVTLGSGPAQ
jgi:hypothetical protein